MKITRILFYIFLLIILFVGVSFAVLNAKPVAINYYFNITQIPLSLLLVYAFGAGLLLALAVMFLSLIKLKIENRSLKKTVKKIAQQTQVTYDSILTDTDNSKPNTL